MKQEVNITKRMSLITISFLLLSIFTAITMMFFLWFLIILGLSIFLLIKNKSMIRKADIMISMLLSGLVIISNIAIALFTFPAALATIVTLRNHSSPIQYFNLSNAMIRKRTICCMILIGTLLGCFNLLLSYGQYTFHPVFHIVFLFHALRAGIFEEICFRVLLYAFCIELCNKTIFNKTQSRLLSILMILPHAILHFNGFIDIGSILVLSLCFGLPFYFMIRKVNVLSAIGAHSMVDLIRFISLGS